MVHAWGEEKCMQVLYMRIGFKETIWENSIYGWILLKLTLHR